MKNRTPQAFTLIELLIVVAIIAILAAIAVPNFLEAQVRSKVARVKADQRSIATALESYVVDYNRYPPHYDRRFRPARTVQPNAFYTLDYLTTPIAYLTSVEAARDAFIQNTKVKVGPGLPGAGTQYEQDYMQYQTYQSFVEDYGVPQNFRAWALYSLGPDREDDAIQFRAYNYAVTPSNGFFAQQFMQGTYDPTNGTISQGDILRLGGEYPAAASLVIR